MSPNEETLKQRAVRVYEKKSIEHEAGPVERVLDHAIMKLSSLALLLVGLAIVPYHMMKAETGHGAPELSLIVLSVIFVLLGSAGTNPKATKLTVYTVKELLPVIRRK